MESTSTSTNESTHDDPQFLTSSDVSREIPRSLGSADPYVRVEINQCIVSANGQREVGATLRVLSCNKEITVPFALANVIADRIKEAISDFRPLK